MNYGMHTIHIQQNIPLAPYTTLGVGGQAEYFCEVANEHELREAIQWAQENKHPVTILGGGSNVLVAESGVRGLVLRICFTDSVYKTLDATTTEVTGGAGILLNYFIGELVSKKLWGLENLSAIPGTVGAVPVQNVGAYGVEVADVITKVSVYDTVTNSVVDLSREACAFGYRDSIFKKEEGKRYIIVSVTFMLSNVPNPKLAYKDIQEYFIGETVVDILRIREAIIAIRALKFPDWNVVGTAGSFFKNPIISKSEFERLQNLYPGLPGFSNDEGNIKISLGYILDKVCNLKGYREGRVGLYEKQALVLVCDKGTSWSEVYDFSQKIIESVFEKTGIQIEREVTVME